MVGGLPVEQSEGNCSRPADLVQAILDFTELSVCTSNKCFNTCFGCVDPFERGNEITDTAELSVDRGETDVGDFAHTLELLEHQFADVLARNISAIALLQCQLELINKGFEPFRGQTCFLACTA